MRAAVFLLMLLASGPALAHAGHVHWWEVGTTWTWDPWVVLPLVLSAVLYTVGVARLWRRAGVGRGVRRWQVVCFALGWLLLAAALVAPLHWLGERLFSAHMIEHEVLMTLAAPLLVLARPVGGMLWALPPRWRVVVGGAGQVRGSSARFFTRRDPEARQAGSARRGWPVQPAERAAPRVERRRFNRLKYWIQEI